MTTEKRKQGRPTKEEQVDIVPGTRRNIAVPSELIETIAELSDELNLKRWQLVVAAITCMKDNAEFKKAVSDTGSAMFHNNIVKRLKTMTPEQIAKINKMIEDGLI